MPVEEGPYFWYAFEEGKVSQPFAIQSASVMSASAYTMASIRPVSTPRANVLQFNVCSFGPRPDGPAA